MRQFLGPALPILALGLGCTHVLTINNAPEAFPATPPREVVQVGVLNVSGQPGAEGYAEAIARALQTSASVERIVYPYVSGADVDVVAEVDVTPEYHGAGTNFLVNWPGFLVFAPAWNGYKYQANPRTRVHLRTPGGEAISDVEWEHNYVFHQADMGRTWTQVGWLEYGVTPLIGGLLFIQYDTDQTPAFIKEATPSYGRQVAGRISEALASWPGAARGHDGARGSEGADAAGG